MISKVIVAGGGTGGHLFPGIAVIEELERRVPNLEVLFVGTARGIENRILPKLGRKLELLDVTPLKGKGAVDALRSLSKLPRAGMQAMRILREFRPDFVLGVGGYASGPMLAAARTLGIKTALLEQNASVGLTNRMLSSVVERAYVTYPETASVFGAKKARVVGNPVRRAFVETAQLLFADPDRMASRKKRILVLGGSQGSRALNETVPKLLAKLDLSRLGYEVVHQTGEAMLESVRTSYVQLGIDATVTPFIEDMARAYASSSLVLSRAGATTLAELSTIGRASVLVPFPLAADDHQRKNAEALAASGACVCVLEKDLASDAALAAVRSLVEDDARRQVMALASRDAGRPEAAALVVDDLAAWLGVENAASGQGGGGSASRERREAGARESLVPALVLEREALQAKGIESRKRHPRVRGLRVNSTRPLGAVASR
jgi:UDP-N-acetylglucosamine--N-acetylmuramyl-(pentapeptide) pyrophosphoryl-undecaprenol N-acetylglucosamine transferase